MAKKKSSAGADCEFSFEDFAREQGLSNLERLEKQQQTYRCYSTGSFMLDLAIGEKCSVTGLPGIPERAIVEMFGVNQSLKTATAEALMKNILDADPENLVVCIYGEEPDVDRMLAVGIDKNRVIPLYAYESDAVKDNVAENHLELAKLAVQDPKVKMVLIDSVKSLCSVNQVLKDGKPLDLNGQKEALAARANMMTRFILNFKQFNKRAILFMTNQTSDRIATSPFDFVQNPTFNVMTPGGRGMEFECTLRIRNEARPIWSPTAHKLTEEKLLLGWEVAYKIIKNKYSKRTAYRVAHSDFMFYPPGFQRAKEVLNCAEFLGIVKKTGPAIYVIGNQKIQGHAKAVKYLEENPSVRMELEHEVVQRSEEVYSLDGQTEDSNEVLD